MKPSVGASLYGGPILSDVQFRRQRYGERNVFATRHLPRLVKGGINLIVLPAENIAEAEAFSREMRESKGAATKVVSAEQATEAIGRRSCSCVLGASYTTIESNLDRLDLLYDLGVRVFTMSGNRRNPFTDGCGEREAAGLSYLGIDLIGRLEELGIAIDVSHTSEKGFWDIFDTTKRAVVVASHSNTRHFCENARNLTDEQIKAIAGRGGMVGLSTHPTLVSEKDPELADLAKHMEHIVHLTSDDNAGLGTDFVDYVEDLFQSLIKKIDPSGSLYGGVLHPYPKGIESIEKVGNLFTLLEQKGLMSETLRKLRGDNVLRVLQMVSP